MQAILNFIKQPWSEGWHERAEELFSTFLNEGARYPKAAAVAVTVRSPKLIPPKQIPFLALIHPNNASSGAYGGMSLVIVPAEEGPCLISLIVGTQGLSPDEEVLGRPGHARKANAICSWLNQDYGGGKLVAWAKRDPCRTEQNMPQPVRAEWPQFQTAFQKYGGEIYAAYCPTGDDEGTELALAAFMDLMFEERDIQPKAAFKDEALQIRSKYFERILPTVTESEVADILKARRYVVLEGPPGTGKTRMAQKLLANSYDEKGTSIQFHPNVTYEQFVGGLSPQATGDGLGFQFAPQPGFLFKAAAKAQQQDYLLHVDEINRSDLAKVLGEAVFLFEPKSDQKRVIELAYDFGEPFHQRLELPETLHVLGTMNTADRSIAILDVAIRRRFAFVKIWPDPTVVRKNGCDLMQNAFDRLLSIFVEHASDDAFNLLPGHSYFLENDEKLARTDLGTRLRPLLEEYLAQGYVAGFADEIRAYIQWIDILKD